MTGTIFSVGFRDTFLGESARNFPFQAILVTILGYFGFKTPSERKLGIVLIALIIALNVSIISTARSYPKAFSGEKSSCQKIKVGSFNLLSKSSGYAGVSDQIKEHDLDVVLFQEFTPKWQEGLENLLSDYRFRVAILRADDFGSAVYSRVEFSQKEMINLVPNDPGTIVVTLPFCNRELTFANIHTLPPASPSQLKVRNDQIEFLANYITARSNNWIVMGDFNTTPYSKTFRRFYESSKLNDARALLGLTPSWPTMVPPLWIPIDHVFYSPALELMDIERGKMTGSDHWPVFASFR